MKRRDFLKLSAALALTGAAAACGGPSASSAPAGSGSSGASSAPAAPMIADAAGAELFALEPVTPYTDADLDYNDSGSRTSQERADPALQEVPLVSAAVDGWDTYDTVFVGYPIWWGGAAWPVNGFVTGNDFAGKRVIPFCTSGGSGLGRSGERLAELAGSGDWAEGRRFSAGASGEEIAAWLAGLSLVPAGAAQQEGENTMQITVTSESGSVVFALNGSQAARDLYDQLPLTIEVENFSSNEKIFYPPEGLDTAGAPLAEGGAGVLAYYEPWGDVVMFYGSFGANGSLYALGEAVSGGELIGRLSGSITIEAAG